MRESGARDEITTIDRGFSLVLLDEDRNIFWLLFSDYGIPCCLLYVWDEGEGGLDRSVSPTRTALGVFGVSPSWEEQGWPSRALDHRE